MKTKKLFVYIIILSLLCFTGCNARQQMTATGQDELVAISELPTISLYETESGSSPDTESDAEFLEPKTPSAELTSSPAVLGEEHRVSSSVVSSELVLSSSASSEETNLPKESMPPEVERSQPVQRLIDWIQNGGDTQTGNQAFLQAVLDNGYLLIPYSTRNDLENNSLSVIENTSGCIFDFFTHVSDNLLENEYYMVTISPLTEEDAAKDLKELYYPNETNKKNGSYNGMPYIYFDGYEGIDRFHSVDTAAWFIRDGCLVAIEALYVNNYKPWSEEYFEYFDFETVTL